MAHHNEFTIAHLKDGTGKVELEAADSGALKTIGDDSSGEELITVEKGYHDVIVDLPKEDRKRVLRKVDYRLVPFLAFLYLIAFVDRSNIGNAKIAGLENKWNIEQGLRYNVAVTMFFVTYGLFEVPANIVLKLWRYWIRNHISC